MQPVVTAAEMRALDRAAIEDLGIPAFTLMETAGRAVAAAVERLGGARVAVVCGPGNNGGDGFVAARVLRARGRDAVVYLAVPRAVVRGDAAAHLAVYERAGGVVRGIDAAAALREHEAAIAGSAVAVDALFGVGLARPIEGHLAAVVRAMQRAPLVLAVDVPSGLDADTGAALGEAVQAHHTVALGALKVGLASAPGFARCGAVEVAEIGIAVPGAAAGLVEEADVAGWLPHGDALDHKGRRGHVLVVAGEPSMRGATRLTAIAALRSGAGLVTLAGDGEVSAPDVVMTRDLAGGALGEALRGKAAVVIGPGLGRSAAARERVLEVLAGGVPAVLDADALQLLADDLASLPGAAGPIVITPHPGEAARLLGTTTAAIERDRLAAARALAQQTRAVVVLKGARTIVCAGADQHCSINPTGGPALATGGSGDVLAGAIAALLAQGLATADAARAAVYAHGAAGAALGRRYGRGTVASDLPAALAEALAALQAAAVNAR